MSSWRRPASEETQATVRELRSARARPRWTRPLGIALMSIAAMALLDPDYPMPRAVLQAIRDSRATSEGIVAVEPRGQLAAAPTNFRWDWSEGLRDQVRSASLVVLDAQFSELVRVPVAGTEARVEGPLLDAIGTASEFHWFVETRAQDGVVRSLPVAFAISR